MFLKILGYHQITPGFLSLVFPFGRQQHAQCHFGGLRDSSRLTPLDRGLAVPELQRSGRNIELCYSLKSAEVANDPDRPWSIRQCSVYHSYDLETANSTWLTVKGNDSMRQLIESQSSKEQSRLSKLFADDYGVFKVTLATHVAICTWAVDGWHWFINYLESKLQASTRPALAVDVAHQLPTSATMASSTLDTPKPPMKFSRQTSWLAKGSAAVKRSLTLRTMSRPAPSILSGHACFAEPAEMTALEPAEPDYVIEHEFSFDDLQDVHFLEESVDEALEVIRTNTKVLRELQGSYAAFAESKDCPSELLNSCQPQLHRFNKKMDSLCSELVQQENRLCALSRLLVSRRNLVCISGPLLR